MIHEEYKFTVDNNKQLVYTRLTFNSNNWKKPPGKYGKSNNPNSFEGKYQFGFEEWLFNESTLINGEICLYSRSGKQLY
jgi:hypothetical protein